MQNLTVALDAMGGDFGPRVTVPAAVQALSHFPELKVILVGDRMLISQHLSLLGYEPNARLSVVHSDRIISNSEKPSLALRNNQDSSMGRAIDLVAQRHADACVSGGNTGALMALSRFRLKLLPGIDRPALVSALPTASGKKTWLLDLGANVSSDADSLFQFAVMGAALAEQHLPHPPRVGILNIGVEEIKGNDLVKQCAQMLKQTQAVNFIGYIEGNQLLMDAADVVVCDGFVGNVCLKTCEGTAQLFIDKLKARFLASSIKGWIARKLFSDLFNELKTLNPDQYNGASLLGLRGIVIKSHGSADVSAVVNAIGEAVHEVKRQVPSRISDRLEAVLLERHY
ncbi:phosphate acyltransferase PlsX [Vibrio cincinnatiensis]|uniref:Phosphate acyltransferase n=1 Tax=Vibrio cincinnatiensis DSM 19608 TaxID=1123491 RepID=A0A1T4L825_VIBCI|nr:phosphate acyltransferase PlsX [Vibrio cincinnatiensis]MCG3722890.1 phosphate acyltransferase PlsX [Vibrio cincinnatiensis]MCG3736930.1 phosphate acyltransferase PlsX [Vibrio cincinnatiensis]MCG3747467.1 phosphate acyltransferase PlsX [Vibrio cincinnatiensis]SJZ50763.1 phosphate:acyl-[acyl carrier protein] acyltransferase [Vibrio cincinnatiensis DSM 19608]SUP48167.1 phosphate acyltransferase [Vibrio cincinnatiensis]